MAFLSKEQLLKPTTRRFRNVTLPEFGGEVRLASPSAGSMMRFREHRKRLEKDGSGEKFPLDAEAMTSIIADSVVDADGRPLLSPADATALIEALSPEAALKLVTEALDLFRDEPVSSGNSEPSPSAA